MLVFGTVTPICRNVAVTFQERWQRADTYIPRGNIVMLLTWAKLRNVMGIGNVQARRRIVRAQGCWGTETERMENRALLSAASGLHALSHATAEVAAEPKAAFSYPNVNGSWHVTGDASGDATLTQTKNKVVSNISAMGINVTMKGHFTKAHSHELSGTAHVANPTGIGPKRLAVKVHIDFGSGSEGQSPNSFEGDVSIARLGVTLHVHGDKGPA